ncbi:acyl-CoA carboxylase subunit beta [Ferrimonas pelagia]|uniref:Carboxyl transferase domain-containing protein n=1 Tax=Ferrimonas pelagia TaxID=1177826 RepID=A0ABP9ES38_9GAMM
MDDKGIPAAWQQTMADWSARRTMALAMGGECKLTKQRRQGRGDARQRLERLVDPDSFREFGTLVGGIERVEQPIAPADGIVTGFALLDGRPVLIGAEDFTVQGGSIGFGAHAKRLRLAQLALQERCPLILLLEGAGERASNSLQRHPYAPNDLQLLAQLKGKVPTVAVVMGPSAGHGALSGVLLDLVIMVEGSSLFAAGPPLVAKALGEQISAEALGGASIHTRHSGVGHNRVADESQAVAAVRQFLHYLPQNAWQRPQRRVGGGDEGKRALAEIFTLVPRDNNQPYEIRAVIQALVDDGRYFELQPEYGRSMVLALARLAGQSILIVANQPMVMAGTINKAAATKAAYFLELAADFHLPVLFLADNPGVLPGSAAEREGTLAAAGQMYLAQSRLRAAKLHVTLRKAYGFGSSVMGMNPFDQQTMTLAFPGLSFGGLPSQGGSEAAGMDSEAAARMAQREQQAAWSAADTLAFDEIIDPRSLRNALIDGLVLAQGRLDEGAQPRG